MKKCIAFLLAAIMLFALCACGNNQSTDKTNQETQASEGYSEETQEIIDMVEGSMIGIYNAINGTNYSIKAESVVNTGKAWSASGTVVDINTAQVGRFSASGEIEDGSPIFSPSDLVIDF